MVRTSGIREKVKSNALKELARERGNKRAKIEDKQELDNFEDPKPDPNTEQTKPTQISNSLLSILPKPKNSSAFGPTVKLDKLLKLPERANEATFAAEHLEKLPERVSEDGLVEVDVSRVVTDTVNSSHLVKDLTVEKTIPKGVVLAKGKEKQKNQITYLAQLGKANELEHKEQASQSRMNKAAARSKYGW